MSNYRPMTADEAAKLSLRPDGLYAFEVADAQPATSKKTQTPMIALTLRFYDSDGAAFTVKDWLVHSDNRWAEKKVYDFALSTGLQAKYAAGTMTAEDCLGRGGFAMVTVQKGKAKDDGSGNFPDRNAVKYYTTQKPKSVEPEPSTSPAAKSAAQSESLDEDVPF